MARQPAIVRLAVAALVTVAAVVALIVVLSSGGGHEIVVVTPSAEGVIPGIYVRAAGRPVGHVASAKVTKDHRARLVLQLDDSDWPLGKDTT
ncbi:MAG: hypothetical protein JWN32_501, partial [Solirubrobacterales bacterium]|nr:hypothetical protein [Solirubrobacterales bacterium]